MKISNRVESPTKGKRMKNIITATAFLSVLFLSSLTFAQEVQDIKGWSKSTWGMNEGELKIALAKEGIKEVKKELYSKEDYSNLVIEDYEIAGLKFNVIFIMDSTTKKLKQVNLNIREDSCHPTAYDTLQERLIQKYGKPAFDKKDVSSKVTKIESGWNLKSTIIDITYNDLELANFKVLVITYSERKTEEGL